MVVDMVHHLVDLKGKRVIPASRGGAGWTQDRQGPSPVGGYSGGDPGIWAMSPWPWVWGWNFVPRSLEIYSYFCSLS